CHDDGDRRGDAKGSSNSATSRAGTSSSSAAAPATNARRSIRAFLYESARADSARIRGVKKEARAGRFATPKTGGLPPATSSPKMSDDMADWLHELPVIWMSVVVFAGTYAMAAAIYVIVIGLAAGERARAFKGISPGLLPPLGIIFGLFLRVP